MSELWRTGDGWWSLLQPLRIHIHMERRGWWGWIQSTAWGIHCQKKNWIANRQQKLQKSTHDNQQHSEFDLSDLQGEIRRHYIKEYMKDHDISIYDEYVSIMPDDIYFLSQIAVIERHHGNLALVDECNRRIDEIKNHFWFF